MSNNSSGQFVRAADGSAEFPSIAFESDPQTGFFLTRNNDGTPSKVTLVLSGVTVWSSDLSNNATGAATDAAFALYLRYTDALDVAGNAHMKKDVNSQSACTPLVGGEEAEVVAAATAQLYVDLNALKVSMLAHMLEEGSKTVDGAHKAADTGNRATLNAVPNATSLASAYVLATALATALANHGDQAGVHFHDDATAAAFTMTNAPATSLIEAQEDFNDLLTGVKAHYAKGVA